MNTEEIYEKFYSEIPQKTFVELCKGDPTSKIRENTVLKIGRYVKWLTKLYLSRNLLLEDIDKANEYLGILYGIRNHNKNINIFNFDSLTSGNQPLYEYVSKYVKPNGVENESSLLTNKYFIVQKEAEVLFEDNQWLIVSPKTKEASAFYGANSQWCTRNPDSFETYNNQGKLIIFIDKDKVINNISSYKGDKDKQRRFQYHIQTNQFLNITDGNVITDEVIKLAFDTIQNDIHNYYKQDISYDTFFKIIKKDYNNIRFEDAYKYILTSHSNYANPSIKSYLTRFNCDIIEMLENFNILNPEEKGDLLKVLINHDYLTKYNFDNVPIIKQYFKDFDFNSFKKNIIVLIFKEKLKYEEVIKYLDEKKLQDNEIGDFLTSFSEKFEENSSNTEFSNIYIKLLEYFSKLPDTVLFPSIKKYYYFSEYRVRRANFIENINFGFNDLNFVRDTLKVKIYCLCLNDLVIYELQNLMYKGDFNRIGSSYQENEIDVLNHLLYKKGSNDINLSDNDCNLLYLLENIIETKDSRQLLLLFLYLSINKSNNNVEKINHIIETRFDKFNTLYLDMKKVFSSQFNNFIRPNFGMGWGMSMMFYKYDEALRNILKGKSYTSIDMNNINDDDMFL